MEATSGIVARLVYGDRKRLDEISRKNKELGRESAKPRALVGQFRKNGDGEVKRVGGQSPGRSLFRIGRALAFPSVVFSVWRCGVVAFLLEHSRANTASPAARRSIFKEVLRGPHFSIDGEVSG